LCCTLWIIPVKKAGYLFFDRANFRFEKAPNPTAVPATRIARELEGSGMGIGCLTVAVRVLCATKIKESEIKLGLPTS
jgi:hypothetical protein